MFTKRPRGILHPAYLDFGQPWNFVEDMFYSFADGTGGGAGFTPTAAGIKIDANADSGSSMTVKRVQQVLPAEGKRVMVAARLRLNNASNLTFWFGVLDYDALEPFGSFGPANAAYFSKANGTLDAIAHSERANSASDLDGALFQYPNDDTTFMDLALVFQELSSVEFLWKRSDGTWGSKVKTTDVPLPIKLQPAIAFKKHSSTGFLEVRSLHIGEIK